MNEYRITYKIGEETEQTRLTERSEAAARKDFKAHTKGGTILEIELIAENVTANKDQEREALATIRKIVEELGPNSYVGTAFEGCFQDAEDNIENDFGCSMMQKLESAEESVQELKGKLAAAEERLGELGRLVERLKGERSALEAKLAMQTLPADLYRNLWMFMTGEAEASRERMASSAEIMAEMSDTPQDIAFKSAVASYRSAKARAGDCERMVSALEAFEPKED